MKRKMKKFDDGGKVYDKEDEGILGGKIKYREDDEGRKFVAGKANPYDRNPAEQRYYSAGDVKKGLSDVGDKISNFFGGKKEDEPKKSTTMPSGYEKLDATEGNARVRQIGDYIKKSEPKEEEPYKPTGKTVLNKEADIDEKPAKKVAAKKAAPASKASEKVGKGYEDVTRALRGSEKVGKGYENLDPRSPQEKSRGKKQGVIQYEKGRSMSDWSRNLGKRTESTEDEEEDKAPKGVNIGAARGRKKGGVIRSASARADGCAIRGKTRA